MSIEDRLDHKLECPECDKPINVEKLYQSFLQELYLEIEKLQITYKNICPECKGVKILPTYQWGRYCCGFKIGGPISWLSVGSCAEDIVNIILQKFKHTLKKD